MANSSPKALAFLALMKPAAMAVERNALRRERLQEANMSGQIVNETVAESPNQVTTVYGGEMYMTGNTRTIQLM